jgi:superoxide dismutase, Cu-Zn family
MWDETVANMDLIWGLDQQCRLRQIGTTGKSSARLGPGPNGQPAAGMAAGGHYDPANTGKHLGPHGEGHKGDMPVLTVDASGKATQAVVAPRLTVADVKGRSIMIHAGGDNYSDEPAPLGGGGARIACGVAS